MSEKRWGLDQAITSKASPARPVYREPARIATLAGAGMLILAIFFPFAEGRIPRTDGLITRVSVSGLEGAGDGAILLVFGLMAVFVVTYRGAAESSAPLFRFAPMLLGFAAVLILIIAWRETGDAIAGWTWTGGSGERAAGMWLSVGGSVLLAVAGTYLSVTRRSGSSVDPRARYRPSRAAVAEGVGAVVGGIVLSIACLGLAASVLPAAIVGMSAFVVVVGLVVGVVVGGRLGLLIVGSRSEPEAAPKSGLERVKRSRRVP